MVGEGIIREEILERWEISRAKTLGPRGRLEKSLVAKLSFLDFINLIQIASKVSNSDDGKVFESPLFQFHEVGERFVRRSSSYHHQIFRNEV